MIVFMIAFILYIVIFFAIVFYEKSQPLKLEESIFFDTTIDTISFTNDLGITDIGDPFLLKISENEYYLYCTSAEDGFYCWRSEDMVNWTDKQMCYTRKEDSWGKDSFWAPEVVAYQNQYYLYYTARNENGSLRIGLAISDTPNGPFLDIKNEPLMDFGYATIDGNVLIDEDGFKYLYYARDCSENMVGDIHTSQIYVVCLSDDMKSVVGEPIFLTTPQQQWECLSGDYLWNEGPEVIKHNDTYYLTYSANYYASSLYSIGYATSKSPLGPFVKAEENPILTSGELNDVSGTGHHSFVMSPDNSELWIAYHSHTNVSNPSGDRKVNLARAGFTSDGKLYFNGPLTAAQPNPSGNTIINVTDQFSVLQNNEKITVLTDGQIQVHAKESSLTESLSVNINNGFPMILETDSDALNISSIVLYPEPNTEHNISSIQFSINGMIPSEKYIVTQEDTSPIILSFEPMNTKSIYFIITPKDADKEIRLSEMELFSLQESVQGFGN